MITKYNLILLIGLFLFNSTGNLISQNSKKAKSKVNLEYFDDFNKKKSIVATLKVKKKAYEPFENGEIQFYNILDTAKILLHKTTSNIDGKATYNLEDDLEKYKDSLGVMTFIVEYNGDPNIKSDDAEIEVKQTNLKISFLKVDSVKYIAVDAHGIELNNEFSPIESLDVMLFIKGMFSLLTIGQEVTDETGRIMFEFPVDMPGDTTGVLNITAKIIDNDDYGNVECRGDINWGKLCL